MPELDEFLLSLLAKDPKARPADARAVLESFEQLGRRSAARREPISTEALERQLTALKEKPEDEDLVEGPRREIELPRVAADEPARAVLLRVRDVARVQVRPDVGIAGEEVREGTGAAAEVERAQPLLQAQLAADERADRLEVVLEDAPEEDEEYRVVGDALDQAREESH